MFRSGLARPIPPPLLAGARIDIVGAAGTKTITTDESGVYQIDGLPPGDYSLQLAVPENQVADSFFDGEGSPVEVHLDPGEVENITSSCTGTVGLRGMSRMIPASLRTYG